MSTPPHAPIIAYTHAARAEELADTTEAFREVGLVIEHVQRQTEAPSGGANRRNATAALSHAAAHHRRGLGMLLIEDDIRPSPHLPAWLEHLAVTKYRGPVTLYTPNAVDRYAPEHLAPVMRGEAKIGPHGEINRARTLRGWWGAQAVWVPWAIVDGILLDPRFTEGKPGLGPWDMALAAWLTERDLPLYVSTPSVVQHTAARSIVAPDRRPHMAASYDGAALPPRPPTRR